MIYGNRQMTRNVMAVDRREYECAAFAQNIWIGFEL